MKRKETSKQRGQNSAVEGTRAQNFSPVIGDYFSPCGGVGCLVYSWLALKLLSCMFKSETEALEGFTATAVAPESSSSTLSTLPCGHFFFLSLSIIKASLKLAQTCSLIVPSTLVGVKRPVCRLRLCAGFALHNIPAGSGFTPDVPSQNNSGVQASLETFNQHLRGRRKAFQLGH